MFIFLLYFFNTIGAVTTVISRYLVKKTHPVYIPLSIITTHFAGSLSLTLALCYFEIAHYDFPPILFHI